MALSYIRIFVKNIERAIDALEGTFISDALRKMTEFYEKTGRDIDAFVKETGISCPEGCAFFSDFMEEGGT